MNMAEHFFSPYVRNYFAPVCLREKVSSDKMVPNSIFSLLFSKRVLGITHTHTKQVKTLYYHTLLWYTVFLPIFIVLACSACLFFQMPALSTIIHPCFWYVSFSGLLIYFVLYIGIVISSQPEIEGPVFYNHGIANLKWNF